jgi:hypothetical protein
MEMSQGNYLKQTNREQESKTGPVWGLVLVGGGKIWGKGEECSM